MTTAQQRSTLFRGGYTVVVIMDPRFNRYQDILDAAEDQGIRYHEPRDQSKPTLIFLTEKDEGNFPFVLPRGVTYNDYLAPQIQAQRELWQWGDGTMSRVTVADDIGEPAHTLPDHLIREDARQAGVIAKCASNRCLVVITNRGYLTHDDSLLSDSKVVNFSLATGARFVTVSREEVDEGSSDYAVFLGAIRANRNALRQELKTRQGEKAEESKRTALPEKPAEAKVVLDTTQQIVLTEIATAENPVEPPQTTPSASDEPSDCVGNLRAEPTVQPTASTRPRRNTANNGGRKSFAERYPNRNGDA